MFPSTARAVGAKNQNVRPLRSAWLGSAWEKVDVTRVQLRKEEKKGYGTSAYARVHTSK